MAAELTQPKKPCGGAFGQFLAEKRPEFTKQCEGQKISAVTKLAGEEWKKLDTEGRAPYQKAYEEATKKYNADLEAFLAGGGVKQKGAAALRAEKRKVREEKAAKKAERADKKAAKEAAEPAAKKAKLDKKAAAETKKAEKETAKEDKAKGSDAKAKAKARGKAKAKAAEPEPVDIPGDVMQKAEKAEMADVLTKLMRRDDIKGAGIQAGKALDALQKNDGLLHPARRALLGA
eukprot:TRINITY_DN11738_c0_g1_i1.p2 TRINITY_DN11738_c0_g1~~TRINITY_DN11738_c0_g1_i1.p2  ORF type:complete len:257 (-),score=109.69 TRINITY_DN11738_c0_g1_i1:320-1018(-)